MNNVKPTSETTGIKAAAVGTGVFAATQTARAQGKGLRDTSKGKPTDAELKKPAKPTGPPPIRIGLVGCGGRGMGAAVDCATSSENVEIYALADLWPEKLKPARENLGKALKEKFNVTEDRSFSGFDAHKKVIELCDYILFATPPGFRPSHLRACIEGGKHAFIEKPCAVDPAGVRSVIESAAMATQKNLGILAGTQYRHDPHYVELMKRLHEGIIGDILAAQCYYCGGGVWAPQKRKPEWTDMEYQIRNWYYYTWLSGDFNAEQHVHNLDVMNWVFGGHPVKCLSIGGRAVRKGEEFGNIFDHFSTLYEYPNGLKMMSYCRHWDGAAGKLEDRFVGTKGVAFAHGLWSPFPEIKDMTGKVLWKWEGEAPSPYVEEHKHMIASIRAGKPLNEGVQVAESSLVAVMARMSAYTGQEVTWDFALNKSQIDLFPKNLAFGPNPVDPVAVPGKTKLI